MKRKLKIVIYGSLCLMGMINLGIKLYTREPGPMCSDYPLSCAITAVIAFYFALETFRVIGDRR